MKKDIHPEYRPVIFVDMSSGFRFMTRSTIKTRDKMVWEDGEEYAMVKLEVSSESHSFYTGTRKIIDSKGQVDKFRKKFGDKTGRLVKPENQSSEK